MKEYTHRRSPILEQERADGIIEGRNAVMEALRSGAAIDKIYIAKGDTDTARAWAGASACRKRGRQACPGRGDSPPGLSSHG